MKTIKIIVSILLLLIISLVSVNGQDYCEYLKQSLMFYKANRAGRLPDSDIPWRGNSVLGDSSGGKNADGDGDLSKGYFDAGDGVKFLFPMSFSMTMLSLGFLEAQANIQSCGQTQLYLDTIKWGTDFIMACHTSDNTFVAQVADGNTDHSFWGPPEMINMARPVFTLNTNKPGTDVVMEAASALASASIIWKGIDSSYSSSCLSHAAKLYSFGMNYQGKYSDSIPEADSFYHSSNYKDEIVWGSIWMYKATGSASYLATAEQYYANYGLNYWGNPPLSWDNKAPGCSLLLYQLTSKDIYKSGMEDNLNSWLPGGSIKYTGTNGLAFYDKWGPCRYAASAAFVASVYGGDKYVNFAKSQLGYILGDNPNGQSFVVGMGPKMPINPHHRAAHGSTTNDINNPVNNKHILTGALVGGPDENGAYTDDRTNYITNEVATDYNAGFVGLLSMFSKGSMPPTTTGNTPSPSPSQPSPSPSPSEPSPSPSPSQPSPSPSPSQPSPSPSPSQPSPSPSTPSAPIPPATNQPTTTSPKETSVPEVSTSSTPIDTTTDKPTEPTTSSTTATSTSTSTSTSTGTSTSTSTSTATSTPETTSNTTSSPSLTTSSATSSPTTLSTTDEGTTTDGTTTTQDKISWFIVALFIMTSTFILLN
ncbi:putative glycoside hydrolase [Heterostelium album PN500]|uniref:Endoglucanase n=1 Tax=Heterostelium pallidum (strain ATCC 26659 / Pp 5 / PN500) TaxID=670386 RepID=D3BM70_HETP5|nr:putative glycoside hydrolase [Heterostelium album PN500]EFA77671.1 putative glycoside hydrolase [Heterostelium album PN500]|eukprot:XP_020429799.1 putative glycoside hydrolase [Heterostelium album PN500]